MGKEALNDLSVRYAKLQSNHESETKYYQEKKLSDTNLIAELNEKVSKIEQLYKNKVEEAEIMLESKVNYGSTLDEYKAKYEEKLNEFLCLTNEFAIAKEKL